jgi:phosphoglycerate-specific signal transduction histidine kinase
MFREPESNTFSLSFQANDLVNAVLNVQDYLAELSEQMASLHHHHDKLTLTPLV